MGDVPASETWDRKSSEGDLSSKTLELTNMEGTALHVSSQSSERPISSFIRKRDE